MKKTLSLVLALALLLSAMVFAVPASADELTELHTYETTARELETWNIQLSQAAQDLNVLCNLIDGLLTNDNHGNLVPNAAKEYTTTDEEIESSGYFIEDIPEDDYTMDDDDGEEE